jgi:hypothetical protein
MEGMITIPRRRPNPICPDKPLPLAQNKQEILALSESGRLDELRAFCYNCGSFYELTDDQLQKVKESLPKLEMLK